LGYDYSQAGWSPEVLDYVTGLDAQRNALIGKYAGQNTGLDNPDFLTPQQVQQEASDEIKTQYAPEEVVREYMSRNPLNSANNLNAGVDVRSYGDSRDPSVYDTVRLPYGDNYTFTDKSTGKSYTPSQDELGAFAQKLNLGTGGGNNASNWDITNGAGERVAYDSPYTPSFLKQVGQGIADVGVMALEAIPVVAGTAIGGPIGGALASSLYTGVKTGDPMAALKAGALSYGGSVATGALGSSLFPSGTGSTFLDNALGINSGDLFGLDRIANPVWPNLSGNVAPNFSGPSSATFSGADLSSTLNPGAFTGSTYGGSIAPTSGASESVLTGVSGSFNPGVGALAGVIPAQLATSAFGTADPNVEAVTVEDTRPKDEYGAPFVTPTSPLSVKPVDPNVEAVTVEDTRPKVDDESGLPHVPIPGGSTVGSPKEPSTIDTALKYSPLILALLGLAGGAGGSGSGGNTGVYHKPDALPDIFSAKLPTGGGTGGTGGAFTSTPWGTTDPGAGGRNLGPEDWYKYGFGPEKSFFKNVPGTPIGMAKGGSLAVRGPAPRARSLAVKGPGTGRSDDIPARLSDGEYVMDAETVALLGDGSSKAGADRLDRFRVNVRKHKGKSLAAGRFSVAAKQPEAYMKGRK